MLQEGTRSRHITRRKGWLWLRVSEVASRLAALEYCQEVLLEVAIQLTDTKHQREKQEGTGTPMSTPNNLTSCHYTLTWKGYNPSCNSYISHVCELVEDA